MTKQSPGIQGNVIDQLIEGLKKTVGELRKTTDGILELVEKLKEKERQERQAGKQSPSAPK